jgi:hypothetical protein
MRVHAKKKKYVAFAKFSDLRTSRRICEWACKALDVPFDYKVYGRSSVRGADELDLPLAERWRRSRSIMERPAAPVPSTLEIDDRADEMRIAIPAENDNLKFVALLAGSVVAIGALCYFIVDTPLERFWVLALCAMMGTFLIYAALAFSGKSQLAINEHGIEFRQGRSPKKRSIRFAEIEEIIPAADGIYLVGDVHAVWIQYARNKLDNDYLQRYIEYRIATHPRS